MPHRVRHILLVSSLYESFTLTEDGQLNEALLRQFVDLNLSREPDLTRVSNGAEALELAKGDHRYELVITSLQLGDMNALELARRMRAAGVSAPVTLLAYDNRELTEFTARNDLSDLDRVFLWQGDAQLLIAIVKDLEDRQNVAHDSGMLGVPVILVLEDNVRFYSSFLPMLYAEMMKYARSVVAEGLNLSQKRIRARARPKILLCQSFEEAWGYFQTYRHQLLGIVSDLEFPRHGRIDPRAGVELTTRVRELEPDVPIVLQSSFPGGEALTEHLGVSFLLKGSPLLLQQLRGVLLEDFGFGDFVFRTPTGEEVGRARDLRDLQQLLHTVPAESIWYHGARDHFSNWLRARAELTLAEELRPRRLSEFEDPEHLRRDLIRSIQEYQDERASIVVADFHRELHDGSAAISRIGGGSLGGKARGLAFVGRLLAESDIRERFPAARISVPASVVIGTDVFDQFLERNALHDFAHACDDDEEIRARFDQAEFPEREREDLRAYLESADYPLAVRSSGLLEDSPQQPFAGVYDTYLLPNNEPAPEARLDRLVRAIKRVYASTFSQRSKAFLRATQYRLEEEKMAVIVQRVVGRVHENRYYPDFAGVTRSHDFYPQPPAVARDGVAAVALGLGQAVTDGEAGLRFSPRHPRHLIGMSQQRDLLNESQRRFFALDLGQEGDSLLPTRYGLSVAESDGTLAAVASTWSQENDSISDGITREGVRLVTFAPILKHEVFPLAALLDALLELGTRATTGQVEIEFAVNLPDDGSPPEFGFLQLRPIILSRELEELEIEDVEPERVLCRSSRVLGNGRLEDIRDLVVVRPECVGLGREPALEVARDVARLDAQLQSEGRPYVLIGVGRWGSTDPQLGIPVAWSQIAGSRVIVEAGSEAVRAAPSQGSHFFQNLSSCNVGYFTVNPALGDGVLDWDWLNRQPAANETERVRHLRLPAPIDVVMAGSKGEGLMLKPPD